MIQLQMSMFSLDVFKFFSFFDWSKKLISQLFWLSIVGVGISYFALGEMIVIEDYFTGKNYKFMVDGKREIYSREGELNWEFQPFNKLFKVDKYVYFFRELPILKDNRIHIKKKDFEFLKKIMFYFEGHKQVPHEHGSEEDKVKQTEQKQKQNETQDFLDKKTPANSSPSKEVKRERVRYNIDDLYSTDKNYKIDYVFIDPGHGGRDPGATFYGYVEKDLTLSLSQDLANILKEKNPDFKVILTRNDDSYLSLEERCTIVNENLKANENGIFISVHLNGWVDPEARGIEVFYLSGSDKTIQRKTYRHLEDLAGAAQGYFKKIFSYLKVIQYQVESRFLSYQIIKNIESSVKASIPRGYKEESFYVLKGALMPAVLLELGFISNREDMELINDKGKRKKLLSQVANAVIDYAEEFQKSNGFMDDYYFDKFLYLE